MTFGFSRIFRLAVLCLMLLPSAGRATALTPELVQAMRTPPDAFSSLSCRRLWYLEHKVLAAGRVCLKSERARRAFASAPRCISPMERILSAPVRQYLAGVRAEARAKHCGQ